MSKHTPGPWVHILPLEKEGFSRVGTFSMAAQYKMDSLIAEVYPTGGQQDSDGNFRSDGNMQANARLIAAAPELLEHLTSLIALLNDGSFPTEDEIRGFESVIAKAEGRS